MQQKILNAVNLSLFLCSIVVVGLTLALTFFRSREITEAEPEKGLKPLPVNSFAASKSSYDKIEEMLSLDTATPTLKLPDLRTHLTYYGKNGRPDADENNVKIHLSFTGQKFPQSLQGNTRAYVVYDRKTARYSFSPNNEPTALWIEPRSYGQDVLIYVTMRNEEEQEVRLPEAHAQFSLQEKDFPRMAGANVWEIGKWRVDGTLLARQKAKWVGKDCFLEKHGGDEFEDYVGRHRIDFGDEEVYSAFVKVGDCLIWKEDKWQLVAPGENSLGHPLLMVKKIDERLMGLELWDVEGKGKIVLNLLKTPDLPFPPQLIQDFKFVGARTKTQCLFEVKDERMVIRPNDWLLFADNCWKKLSTSEAIDQYVSRKTTGILFVFDEIARKDERQVIRGTFFNQSRTDIYNLELAMQSPTAAAPEPKKNEIPTPAVPAVNPVITPQINGNFNAS